MVEEIKSVPIKLPAEVKAQLEAIDPMIKSAETAMASLKRLGLDTRSLEDKLTWAKEVKETLLRDFT